MMIQVVQKKVLMSPSSFTGDKYKIYILVGKNKLVE